MPHFKEVALTQLHSCNRARIQALRGQNSSSSSSSFFFQKEWEAQFHVELWDLDNTEQSM